MEPICLPPGTLVDVWEKAGSIWVLGDLFKIDTPPQAYYTVPYPPPRMTFWTDHPQTRDERRRFRRLLGNSGEPQGEVLCDLCPPRPKPAAAQTWRATGHRVGPWYSTEASDTGKPPAARTHSEGLQATTTNKESDI